MENQNSTVRRPDHRMHRQERKDRFLYIRQWLNIIFMLGAVIGVIIFTGLTYCLTFLGIDTNLQFVFKGFIIIAAVALDSVKYLKKK